VTLPARPNQACCLVGHDAPLARVCRGKSPAAGSSPRRSGPRCRNYAEPAVAGYFKKNNLPARLVATAAEDRLNPPIDVIDVCRLVKGTSPSPLWLTEFWVEQQICCYADNEQTHDKHRHPIFHFPLRLSQGQ